MNGRRLVPVLAFLAASACAVGSAGEIPRCDFNVEEHHVQLVTIIQLQAVPDAKWGPCIETLNVGWEYLDQEAKQGEAMFWLASDQLGFPFLEVALRATCDPSDAETRIVGVEGVERLAEVDRHAGLVRVVVVPVAPRHEERAEQVAATLQTGLRPGRTLQAVVSVGDESASVRIEEALQDGDAVVVIDDREVADGTLEVRRPGHDPTVGVSLSTAVAEIEEVLPEVGYVATWYDRFDGGCITYRFNAHGPGAESVAADVDRALGLFPLWRLRELAIEELGHDIAAGRPVAAVIGAFRPRSPSR